MFDYGCRLAIFLLIVSFLFYMPYYSPKTHESDIVYRRRWNYSVPISIHVFAWRRKKSLGRLLDSLQRANYMNHTIPLYIHVDGDPLNSVVEMIESFEWSHGRKHVHISEQRLGMPAVNLKRRSF